MVLRKIGRATLAATAVAALALASLTLVSSASVAGPSPTTPPTNTMSTLASPASFSWTYTPTAATALSGLSSRQPVVSASTVLTDSGNAQAQEACATDATPAAPVATDWFCWSSTDANDTFWNPQGITTSGEASASGTYDGHNSIITSWQNVSRTTTGAATSVTDYTRLSLINYDNPSDVRYRNVYLVEPQLSVSAALEL